MPSEMKKHVLPPPAGLDFATPPRDSLVDDLRYALEHAKELYADVAWDFTLASTPTNIYAHKAILYARSSRSFQDKFLKNKDANGMSIKSVRLSNPEPTIIKTDTQPVMFRQELKFFYTGEEGSEEFLAAVDTTDELEQDKLKEDLIYMFTAKLYTDVELVLDYSDDSLEIIGEDEEAFKPIKIRAHRFMLFTRSEYFKRMLNSNFIEARSSQIHLDASIFNQTSLHLILTFIYTGSLPASKPLTLDTCEWVWIGADFLGIKLLCDECVYRIATKVHYFSCTCAECQVVVPRVAGFAKENEIDTLWQGCLHVLSHGFDNMWPQKAFADLNEDTREEVLLTVLANTQNNNIMAIFKGCRKIISMIDIKGIGLPWIETIRKMTNQVRSYTVQILVDNFEQLCSEDQEFLDCVDGVGFSTDLLEDIMNIIVEEGLTEQNAARVLKCISGKLLTRQAVMSTESFETKRVLTKAKQDVFDYIKKRWISVKQNGGFRLLSPWLLDEFSKELGVTNQELQEPTDSKENKPKVRTPSAVNGLSKKGRESSPAPTSKTNKSAPLIITTPPQSNASNTTSSTTMTNDNSGTNGTHSASNPSAESSSMGTTAKTNGNGSKKGKSVRIGETTTAPSWVRPTRASLLREQALAESSAKNPVKPRIKTTTPTKPASSSSSTNSTQSKSTSSISKTKTMTTTTTRTPRPTSSTSSLGVPNGTSASQRGRSASKQNTSTRKNASAASSRASSISSVTSLNSPSVSPSRFGGVRQTRSSMLRQLKYDDVEQRRGRGRDRGTSPTSSRASSIASVSSVTSTTTSSKKKRSPSQTSTSTSATSTSNGPLTSLPPKPYQIKLATNPNSDISVGRRVILPTKNNAPGVIQFLGETEFAKGNWVGIELDNPVGKNNGVVANTKYFAAGANHGIFVRPDSLLLI